MNRIDALPGDIFVKVKIIEPPKNKEPEACLYKGCGGALIPLLRTYKKQYRPRRCYLCEKCGRVFTYEPCPDCGGIAFITLRDYKKWGYEIRDGWLFKAGVKHG